MAIFPNCAVTFGKGWRVTLLLLLATVFKQGHSQITCNIEIDSKLGLWRDVTPKSSQYCSNYKYRETRLRCTAAYCPRVLSINDSCTVYYNAEINFPCLATCNGGCTHTLKCHGNGDCPCTQAFARYKKAKMCVPYNDVQKCTFEYYIGNQCVAPLCTDTCPNGWCDSEGFCTCYYGFSRDSKTGMCVPNECTQACVEGTCHTYGACTCQDDSVVGPREGYQCPTKEVANQGRIQPNNQCAGIPCDNGKCYQGGCKCNDGFRAVTNNGWGCVEISCQGEDSTGFCKRVCKQSRCKDNGWCDFKGTCNCNDGFRVDTNNRLNCVKIDCTDPVNKDYCQRVCQRSPCKDHGNCVDGACICNHGFKKSTSNIYQCDKIHCPATAYEDKGYCKGKCDERCHSGQCDNYGTCSCNLGYKKSQNNLYQCDKIQCPAKVGEDNNYCKTQCDGSCKNGQCDTDGVCTCYSGYKKARQSIYQCDQIKCPSNTEEDNTYCHTQCNQHCNDGRCGNVGTCICDEGYKKAPNTLYNCKQIQCPAKNLDDNVYCTNKCYQLCHDGWCGTDGACTCNDGFKKLPSTLYQCHQIECPSRAIEDNVYCKSQCSNTCENGKCNKEGVCLCDENFVPVNWTMRVNCHHECNEDGSCPLAAILGGIVGVGSVIVIAIIVTAALLIRKRNRKEREEREQGDTQNIPLETLHEEPEYINHEQEEEMEENVMYRSVAWHANRYRVH